MGFSETWLEKNININYKFFDGFNFVFSNALREKSVGRASGGLLLAIKNYYSYDIINISNYWIFVKIHLRDIQFIVGLIYFKPSI